MIDMTNELYQRIDEVLHYVWDPVGIKGYPDARDEYYAYVPKVQEAILRGDSEQDITELLIGIAVESIGLNSSDWLTTRSKDAAYNIFSWVDYLKEKQDYLNDSPK